MLPVEKMMGHYTRRLRIWESRYGRAGGWVAEYRGRNAAVLTDCRFEEMFWESYRVELIADNPDIRQQLATQEFWQSAEAAAVVWRSREFGETAPHTWSAGIVAETGRLVMRGLYLRVPPPRLWDEVVLWARRMRESRKEAPPG